MEKIIISLLTIFIVGGVASIAWLKVAEIESTLLSNVSVVNLEVNKGDTLYRINQRLLPYADIDTLGFKMWLKLNPEYSRLKRVIMKYRQNRH